MTARPTHVLVLTEGRCETCSGTGSVKKAGVLDAFAAGLGAPPAGTTCAACIGTGKQIGRVTLENLRKVMK